MCLPLTDTKSSNLRQFRDVSNGPVRCIDNKRLERQLEVILRLTNSLQLVGTSSAQMVV